ncbi:hypothetical protein [Polaribacter aestuariivivens]|uniref:hypothetical protein n=1 Tax=Polaribacter aestuariivivens TaxID=2304626 RepID=UPI003F495C01
MTTQLRHFANGYKDLFVADLEEKIENMDYELSITDKSKEELVLVFINSLLAEFDRHGTKIEGFLDGDRRNELETILVDFSRTQYNIDVYDLLYSWD